MATATTATVTAGTPKASSCSTCETESAVPPIAARSHAPVVGTAWHHSDPGRTCRTSGSPTTSSALANTRTPDAPGSGRTGRTPTRAHPSTERSGPPDEPGQQAPPGQRTQTTSRRRGPRRAGGRSGPADVTGQSRGPADAEGRRSQGTSGPAGQAPSGGEEATISWMPPHSWGQLDSLRRTTPAGRATRPARHLRQTCEQAREGLVSEPRPCPRRSYDQGPGR